jgi:hypothetical protein
VIDEGMTPRVLIFGISGFGPGGNPFGGTRRLIEPINARPIESKLDVHYKDSKKQIRSDQ